MGRILRWNGAGWKICVAAVTGKAATYQLFRRNSFVPLLSVCYLSLAIQIVGQIAGLSAATASEQDRIEPAACPIHIASHHVAVRDISCHQRITQSGSILSWAIVKNRHYRMFLSLSEAGPRLIFPYSDGTEKSATYHLSHFGYIRENFETIEPAELRVIQTADSLEVRLHRIDLASEKNCLGFSTGIGEEHPGIDTGAGHQRVASALICPRQPAQAHRLVDILSSLHFKQGKIPQEG